jgi:hypothetical protein
MSLMKDADVDFHLENGRAKRGAATRTQGMISISLQPPHQTPLEPC